uniref:At1g20880/F9H16_14 n=1 Tax=Arabidopsis thaliana TaxID=3702 RepID=Q8H1N8_ARATH|nr:At1g20880/F9H16_14 [Arabidopsis thaliana]
MAYHSIPSSGFHYLNSPFGDTTFTKVFVGGLAWETQSETLRRHFDQYGDILEAVVITDKNTGRSKGYGFVTFRDPEAARRACVDPTPIIDGRRANCNLASLGRSRPPMQYAVIPHAPGRVRPHSPYVGSVQSPRGLHFGSHPYHQPPTYNYQQGVVYPYGVTPYGPDYMYSQSQGFYGPYMGQQYLQVYGVPGAVNSPGYQYGQLSHTIPGAHGYTAGQGYSHPGSHVLQLGATSPMSAIQSPYPSPSAPTHQRVIVQTPPQYIQSSGSDQTTG